MIKSSGLSTTLYKSDNKNNTNFEIYLNLTSIKFINKPLWRLILNYPNEMLYEIKKNLTKLLLTVHFYIKISKKSKDFSIFLVSHENFNMLYERNINLKFYKKLITSNLKIVSQSNKKIKLVKIKLFCRKCNRLLSLKFTTNRQSIDIIKILILIHHNKQYSKCTREFIYFVKNSSTFVFEKFLKCKYTLGIRRISDSFVTLIGIISYVTRFPLITSHCYDLIGTLDICKEKITMSKTKRIFIIIKILGLKINLYKDLYERFWYNLTTIFYPVIKTNTFLDKIKALIFKNISGLEILKTTITCLLLTGYCVQKKTLIQLSEKIILGLISHMEFYNLLVNRLLSFSYTDSFTGFNTLKERVNYNKSKKLSINDFMIKFKKNYKNIIIFENIESKNNLFYEFLYELNVKDKHVLMTNDHYVEFTASICIITTLGDEIYRTLNYISYGKENTRMDKSFSIFGYYDLVFDIKKKTSSNTAFEKKASTLFSNLSFFKILSQKNQNPPSKEFDFILIIYKMKSLKIAYFTERLIKYIIKLYVMYRKLVFFFDTIVMNVKNLNLIFKLARLIAKANLSIYVKKKNIDKALKIISYSQINFVGLSTFQKFKPIRINYFNIIRKLILNIFFKINLLSIGKLFSNLKKLGVPVVYSNYVILTFLINQRIVMIGNYLKINNNYKVVKSFKAYHL